MSEPRQASPEDERTPEQWAQFRQAETQNQDELTRREASSEATLEVQNIKHGSSSKVRGQ